MNEYRFMGYRLSDKYNTDWIVYHVSTGNQAYGKLNENAAFNKKKAKLVNNISSISKRESYLRGFYFKYKNENLVKCLSDQDSSLLKMLAISNCLIKIPANSSKYSKNKLVEIISLPNLF